MRRFAKIATWLARWVPSRFRPLQEGISLIGYPFHAMGVGEAMRSLARAIESAAIDYDVVNFDGQKPAALSDLSLQRRCVDAPSKSVNVFCVNAGVLDTAIRKTGQAVLKNRHNIIRPFWELARIDPRWAESLKQVDEIWAPTTFVRDAFAAGTKCKVTHIPVSVSVPDEVEPDRARFGIPSGATAFLFAFDFWSYPARKNPEAVLEAYRQAFEKDKTLPVALVIKTMGENPGKQAILNSIRKLAQGDERIVVIDDVLSRSDMYRLIASCDVFVSLHRSEGFGLGIAEAMAMGKAVIATDFSGSTDFVNHRTGFPVSCRLVDVKEDEYPYFIEGQKWAEPDIDEAARIMKRLAQDRAALTAVGNAAKSYMAQFHSAEAVGKIVAARLRQIDRDRSASASYSPTTSR